MQIKDNTQFDQPVRLTVYVLILLLGMFGMSSSHAAEFTLNVVDGDGNQVDGFRYVLQEDTTFAVDPNDPATNADDILSLSFHASNQPVATAENDGSGHSGNTDASSVVITDVPDGRYYVSVLPYSGHSIGGAPVNLLPGSDVDNVTVTVQSNPIPTAQIAIFLFQDNWPLNGAPDLPEEDNPGSDGEQVDWSQFNIILEEPAGRYGVAGGQVISDAFGNPIGTTYNANGTVNNLGDGTIQPDPDTGTVLIKNLAPGKYGVVVSPPTGQGWQQTSTIEGSPVIDAWVKANEPPLFVEFGLPGPHVFIGFTKEFNKLTGGGATISGTVTDMHMSRPPKFQFFSGREFPGCWVALNEGGVANGEGLFAGPCSDSDFSIPNVDPGSYVLTIFDTNLDVVIAQQPITVTGSGCNGANSCALGEVAVFNWFTRLNTAIFSDDNQNGFWDDGEVPAGAERGPVQLRWRDGTIYQVFGTDTEGLAPFDEVFPFFHWLVAEVGFARDKITGATFVVDAGGEVDTTVDTFPGFGELTPQAQAAINPNTNDDLSRTELGPVLTQAFQGFLGQTSVMQFGTTPYLQNTTQLNPPQFPPQFIGENGGISGMVFYGVTRAENEPELAAAEEWEPGVPRVQVAMYADGDIDTLDFPPVTWPTGIADIDWDNDGELDPNDLIVDDVDGNGCVGLADVDNPPLGNFPGNEDIDRGWQDDVPLDNTNTCTEIAGNGSFDYHDALNVTWTDSWDDSQPEGCQGVNNVQGVSVIEPPVDNDRCFDGLRSFNQVRPGVFDGGWAFDSYSADALAGRTDITTKLSNFYTDRIALAGNTSAGIARLPDEWMLPGEYIIETATPPGYKLMEEEHKNVDFGDEYEPSTQAFPQTCVGDMDSVPPLLAMATKDGSGDMGQLIPGINAADAAAPFAGDMRPLCDRKSVQLSSGQNAAADFFVMTDVPIAGNVSGVALNDLANEFNPNSPAFGEKYAPPFTPVGFYDWNGAQVNRVYADQYGKFNALLPSTYTTNLPQPSGMSPNMIVSCMNDAGPIPNPGFCPDPTGTSCLPDTDPDAPESITDPFFNPQFSQFCYTFQYMPGAITYLDTPVESIAAFANPIDTPVDCQQPHLTPMISKINRRNVSGGGGPFVVGDGTVGADQQIRISGMGRVKAPNPEWDGVTQSQRFITRDYRFGNTTGNVYLQDVAGNRTELAVITWNMNRIDALVGQGQAPGDYQVIVSRIAGSETVESPLGVTLTVGVADASCPVGIGGPAGQCGVRPNSDGAPYAASELYAVHAIGPNDDPNPANDYGPIQEAIETAAAGDLILVGAGTYDELVIMWKPVKLQGWGAGEVFLNARQSPTEKIISWRTRVEDLVGGLLIDPLPGQELPLPGFPALGARIFATEEGAGIFVAGKASGPNSFAIDQNRGARIDGFTIVGASQGGAIVANGNNQYLNISNNRLTTNAGFFGGGIRVGHPTLTFEDGDDLIYPDAMNDNVRIHHNQIVQNGNTFGGAGAGISIHTGADDYRVQDNWICGNFSQGDGAGIGHLGLSNGGVIEDNQVIFNESFQQAGPVNGAGIFVGGKPALQPVQLGADALMLSPGSGTVTIDSNLIRGNLAGAGDGGGIRIQQANGLDIVDNLGSRGPWYDVRMYNNMINNNVTGLAGAVSIQDSLSTVIRNNTVANNDSTATTALAFNPLDPLNQNGSNVSTPQPAGIVSRVHTADLETLMTDHVTANMAVEWETYSRPVQRDNIVYQNRSFFWTNFDDPATAVIETSLVPATCQDPTDPLGDPTCNVDTVAVNDYTDDYGVLSGISDTGQLHVQRYSLLTPTVENLAQYNHPTNCVDLMDCVPAFVNPYFNSADGGVNIPEFKTLQTAIAADEGGNFIQVTFGPLSLVEPGTPPGDRVLFDYHITEDSDANGAGGSIPGSPHRLAVDFDGDARPMAGADIGADEN